MARISTDRFERVAVPPLPGVVVPFPGGKALQPKAREPGQLPAAPQTGERPTIVPSSLRDWVRMALIVSVALHAVIYVGFNVRFEDDLERAAGAAAAAANEGTITIPIELVVEQLLPSAPAPTDATASEADQAIPVPAEIDPAKLAELMPVPPEPAPVVLPEAKMELPPPPEPAPVVLPRAAAELPPPPEPAPVVLPTRREAMELALPEEETAKPFEAKTAAIPEAPATAQAEESPPPLPLPREAPPVTQERPREDPKQAARSPAPQKSAPSRAASPSRTAASSSVGSSGAGGRTDSGGRAAISSYFARVQAHLSRQVYPPEARANGLSGVVRVVFSLGRDGRVLSLSLARGSGHGLLDQAALAVVRRAAPFPPFPREIAASRLEMGAPIRFDLR